MRNKGLRRGNHLHDSCFDKFIKSSDETDNPFLRAQTQKKAAMIASLFLNLNKIIAVL